MQTCNIQDKNNKNYEVIYNFSDITIKAFEKVKNEDVLGQLGFCPEARKFIWQKETLEIINLKNLNKSKKDFIFKKFKEDLEKDTLKVAIENTKARIRESKEEKIKIQRFMNLDRNGREYIRNIVIELRKKGMTLFEVQIEILESFSTEISIVAVRKICKEAKKNGLIQ